MIHSHSALAKLYLAEILSRVFVIQTHVCKCVFVFSSFSYTEEAYSMH